jgi:1,5-anhydro-D-fructose reductase (1,5-anhydro-D-mannitol-forming)
MRGVDSTVRLGLLSFWHVHAADYAQEAAEHPETEIVAVWDEQPERGRVEAAARGLPFVDSLQTVLADPNIDGVIVTTATTAHGSVIPAAAAAGKHVFAEKVIAPTLRESLAIVDAVERAGVTMTIALSRAQEPATDAIRELIVSRRIGQPTSSRIRFAHDGALPAPDRPDGWLPVRFYDPDQSGGGAMIDLGAHPLYLTRLFLGLPETVTSVYGDVTGRGVDDNAVAVFGYTNGAIGIAETSLVSGAPGSAIVVTGTEGTVRFMRGDDHLTLRRGRESDRIEITVPSRTPFQRWVESVQTGTPTTSNLTLALELSALTEAAGLSAASGRAVRLDEIDGYRELNAR